MTMAQGGGTYAKTEGSIAWEKAVAISIAALGLLAVYLQAPVDFPGRGETLACLSSRIAKLGAGLRHLNGFSPVTISTFNGSLTLLSHLDRAELGFREWRDLVYRRINVHQPAADEVDAVALAITTSTGILSDTGWEFGRFQVVLVKVRQFRSPSQVGDADFYLLSIFETTLERWFTEESLAAANWWSFLFGFLAATLTVVIGLRAVFGRKARATV